MWPRIQTAWCFPPLPPLPPPPSLLPSLAAAATRGSGRGERAEPGARRQLLTLGVAEVSLRGSRLRSAEQRRRLPRAEPLGPQEEPEEQEEEEDWGSAAWPHNAQRAGRRRRGTCAPRRAGRPVLAGIAERLLEWGAGGAEAGGPRVHSLSNAPGARLQEEERGGESETNGDRLLPDHVPSSAGPCGTLSRRPCRLQEAEARGVTSAGAAGRGPRHLAEVGFSEIPCPGEGKQGKFSPFPGARAATSPLVFFLSSPLSPPYRVSFFSSPLSPCCCASQTLSPLLIFPCDVRLLPALPCPSLFLTFLLFLSFLSRPYLLPPVPFFWFLTSESGPAQELLPFL